VVVRSKKECGIAWGSGAHLHLAGGFPVEAGQLFTTIITIKSRFQPPHNAMFVYNFISCSYAPAFNSSLFLKITIKHFPPIPPPVFLLTRSGTPFQRYLLDTVLVVA
jgi:hypothetical protein